LTDALRWFSPSVGPIVQLVTVATPLAFVTTVVDDVAGPDVDALLTVPPPAVTAKVTLTPPSALPFVSNTVTEGGSATAVLTTAL
jgi:hypothetical protein